MAEDKFDGERAWQKKDDILREILRVQKNLYKLTEEYGNSRVDSKERAEEMRDYLYKETLWTYKYLSEYVLTPLKNWRP